MAGDTLDPTLELVTLFGRLPEAKRPESPARSHTRAAGLGRRCNRCGETKARDAFYVEPKWAPGLKSTCKDCSRRRERERREHLLATDPTAKRRLSLKFRLRNYGLTPEQYDAMWAEQDGKCAICRRVLVEEGKATHVDHCHKTGRIRSLLCFACNHAVGWIEKAGCPAADMDAYLARHKKADEQAG